MDNDNQNNNMTNKEKAYIAGKDVAKVVGRYYGGPIGAAINTELGQKAVSKHINKNPLTRAVLAKNQEKISDIEPVVNSLIDNMSGGEKFSAKNFDQKSNIGSGTDNKKIEGKGVLTGGVKKIPLKYKLIIIGVIFAFISLVVFLIILITPLMHLGIIEYNGNTSSGYISPTYSYCNSINVDGNLYSLEDYVAGVVEAEVGMYLSTGVDEALKAQAIAARTYALYYTNGCKNPIGNGQNVQVFDSSPSAAAKKIANDTAGMVMAYNNDLFLSEYDSFCYSDSDCPDAVINPDGSYTVTYTILPSGEVHTITLSDSSYYGHIVNGGGHARGMSQLVAFQYAKQGMDYMEILDSFYSNDVDIVNIRKMLVGTTGTQQGNDYIGTYTNAKTGKTYKNYKQYLYRSDAFTFEGKDHLANVGCGTNAAAIILSGEDSSITPAKLYIENGNHVGTYFGDYYPYDKDSFSYCNSWEDGWCVETNSKTKIGNKETRDKLISNLSNGGTAILFINYSVDKCTINGESWTGSQHFFTALDYNPADNTIFISNPGTNSSSQNGWVSLDEFDCVHIAWLMFPE